MNDKIIDGGAKYPMFNVPVNQESYGGEKRLDIIPANFVFAVRATPQNPDGLVKEVTKLFGQMDLEANGQEYRESVNTYAPKALVCEISRNNGSVEVYGFIGKGKALDGSSRRPYASAVENTLVNELGFSQFPLMERVAVRVKPMRDYFKSFI
jgi:hypothetical protein